MVSAGVTSGGVSGGVWVTGVCPTAICTGRPGTGGPNPTTKSPPSGQNTLMSVCLLLEPYSETIKILLEPVVVQIILWQLITLRLLGQADLILLVRLLQPRQ